MIRWISLRHHATQTWCSNATAIDCTSIVISSVSRCGVIVYLINHIHKLVCTCGRRIYYSISMICMKQKRAPVSYGDWCYCSPERIPSHACNVFPLIRLKLYMFPVKHAVVLGQLHSCPARSCCSAARQAAVAGYSRLLLKQCSPRSVSVVWQLIPSCLSQQQSCSYSDYLYKQPKIYKFLSAYASMQVTVWQP